jgi:uncharacterized protein YgbK (DUF1537 family)
MKLTDLMAGLPPVRTIPAARARIARQLTDTRTHVIVVDDDPTGTQTVHDVRVYMDWSVATLRGALTSGDPASFISANTRALPAHQVTRLAEEIGQNVRKAAAIENARIVVASRSDSTLRGHYPCEVESLARGLAQAFDGVVLAPALFEAGRYTVNNVHWVDQGESVVPAAETEFARDPTFGYANSDLRLWVEEKTAGRVRAAEVRCLSLDTIRLGGPDAVEEELVEVAGGQPVIVNSVCYEDHEALVLGLVAAEMRGKSFIYRCAAPFVKVRAGIEDRPHLTAEEIGASDAPGLIVVGSHVAATSRQVASLMRAGLAAHIELNVDMVLDDKTRDHETERVVSWIGAQMTAGKSTVVYTSRTTRASDDVQFLAFGEQIMSALCRVVGAVSARPGFVLAKGGITSVEVARAGLGVKGAVVLGQIRDGVAVWRLGDEARWPGVPYVVFPGNVGDDNALRDTVAVLMGRGA